MITLKRTAGLFLILAGILFLVNSYFSVTGFSIYQNSNSSINKGIGFIFAIIGLLILILGVENKVIRSRVKSDPLLLRVAHDLGDKPVISRDVNHLINELNKGNTNPGSGTKSVFSGVYAGCLTIQIILAYN